MDSDAHQSGRTLTVLLALAANVAVGVLKLIAGLLTGSAALLTGSAALLSESAHSAGDSTTELLLLFALRRSQRPADRAHPFGYGKERYFWSLLAAVAIFVCGAAFSMYEGVHTILGPSGPSERLWLNYPVLALAFLFEGLSFLQAARQVRHQTTRRGQSLSDFVREPGDPTLNSVALEDSTALVGIIVAAVGVGLHQLAAMAARSSRAFGVEIVGGRSVGVLRHRCGPH